MPSVTCFGKCWVGRAIIQFTALMFNPFSLNSYSDSQGQPLLIFIQPSWFILWTDCTILHLAPLEGKSSPPSLSPAIHHPHSSALLLPPLELALCSSLLLQNRGIFNISTLFLHLPFPTCPAQGVSSYMESSTALFATQILECPLHPCLHMPLACSSSGRIWSQMGLPLSSYSATFCSKPEFQKDSPKMFVQKGCSSSFAIKTPIFLLPMWQRWVQNNWFILWFCSYIVENAKTFFCI